MQKDMNIQQSMEEETEERELIHLIRNTASIREDGEMKWNVFSSLGATFKEYFSDSFLGATFNLSNATIGAGILFLPFVIRECGVVLGILFFIIGAVVESLTLYLLYKSFDKITTKNGGVHKDLKDYEQIGQILYGYLCSFFIQFCIFLLNFGGTISYAIIIAHLLSGWVEVGVLHSLLTLAILFPLVIFAMVEKIANLRFLSYFAMLNIIVFSTVVIIGYFIGVYDEDGKPLKRGKIKYFPDFTKSSSYLKIFSILGIISFSYSCHTILYPIMSQFQKKNRYKVGISVFLSILIDYLFFAIIAEFGYLTFLDNTKSDIILSYTGKGWISNTLRVTLLLTIICSYSLCSYVGRYTFDNLLYDIVKAIRRKDMPKRTKQIFFLSSNIIVSSLIGIASYAMAIFYPHASSIFGLSGSSAAIATVYIFPCLFYLKLYKLPWANPFKFLIIFILFFGGFLGTFVTAVSLTQMISTKFGKF